jgi:general secretion pathway protein D
VNLSITPRVTYQDEIILDPIVVDKSGVGPSVDVGGIQAPTFVKRTAQVAMRLRDGESNLLAGLIKEEDREIAKSLPGINRVPILRSLFGNTVGTNEQSDIIMIVTPHIIRSARDHGGRLEAPVRRHQHQSGRGHDADADFRQRPVRRRRRPSAIRHNRARWRDRSLVSPPGRPRRRPEARRLVPRHRRGPTWCRFVPIEAAGGPPPPAGARVLVQLPETSLQVGGPPYTLPLPNRGRIAARLSDDHDYLRIRRC